jgi:hypothetical protein
MIENHTPFPTVLGNPYSNSSMRTLKIMPRNLKEIVRSNEFGFWSISSCATFPLKGEICIFYVVVE